MFLIIFKNKKTDFFSVENACKIVHINIDCSYKIELYKTFYPMVASVNISFKCNINHDIIF